MSPAGSRSALLDLPLQRLPRAPKRTRLAIVLARLDRELDARKLPRVPCWFSTDWFSPDGVLGMAVPYYLASDELLRLERETFGHLEDQRAADCMRFLRHEAGHAVDTAFGLARRKEFRETFGPASAPYRSTYAADPRRTDFVQNLPRWYAQSHAKEDFAETFAVWLDPRSRWRSVYASEPRVLAKLERVDRWMLELRGTAPSRGELERTNAIHTIDGTVGKLAARRLRAARREAAPPFENALLEIFESSDARPDRAPAAPALRELQPRLARLVSKSTGISDASFGILWTVLERFARLQGLGELQVTRRAATVALERALNLSVNSLTRGTWVLHR